MQKLFTILLLLSASVITTNLFAQDSSKVRSLNEVIITGQYKPQSIKNSVYQVRVINSQKIKLSGATNLQQALNTELGFRFPNDKLIGTDLTLNGVSGRNIKILLDGIPMSDRSDERLSLSQIDINSIERIEIVEGPMSVSYGTDAMGGVINIITKKNYLNGLSVTARVQEETAGDEYHAFNYKGLHTQNIGLGYKKSNWDFSAGGSHVEFDGFGGDQYGRGKSWLPKEQWFGNGKIGYSTGKFNVYYRIDGLQEDIKNRSTLNLDLPSGIARGTDAKYSTDRYMHQLQGNIFFNKNLALNSMVSYTDLKRTVVTINKDLIKQTSALSTADGAQDVSKLHSFTFKNTVQFSISSKLSLQPGLDITSEKASGGRIKDEPSIDDYAFFVSAEYKPTSKINIRPGVRFEKNSVFNAPPAIPSLNTKFIFGKNLDLRLAYGYGFRAPVLRELYFNFDDANHKIYGNTDLKAETSNSFNGSLTWTAPKMKGMNFTSTFGTFYNSFRNQIVLDIDKRVTPTALDPRIPFSYFNVDKVRTAGFSLDNRLAAKNFNASLGFNYIGLDREYDPSYVKTSDKKFLWTPEINASFVYTLSKIKSSLALYYKYNGVQPRYTTGTTASGQTSVIKTETNPYHFADFTASTSLVKYLSISAGVKNIFDVTDVTSNAVTSSGSAHSTAGNLSLSYGRSYFVGVAFQWHQKK